jgi:hypothetical protein
MRSAPVALAAALRAVLPVAAVPDLDAVMPLLERFARTPIRNTRSEVTGELHAAGELRFSA